MAGDQGKNNVADAYKNKKLKEGNRPQTDTDWDSLREEWIRTNISLAGLSNKYEIPMCTVRKHYYSEDWTNQLREYKGMIAEELQISRREKAKEIASRVDMMDETVLAVSERLIDVISEHIENLDDNKRQATREILGVLKVASDALKNAHHNVRLAGDKSTSIVESSNEHSLSKDDEKRIEDEFGFISKKRIPKEESSKAVAGNKPSQDTQE